MSKSLVFADITPPIDNERFKLKSKDSFRQDSSLLQSWQLNDQDSASIQLIIGKTARENLHNATLAVQMCKQLKIGQLIYVTGKLVPRAKKYEELGCTTYDLIVHKLHTLNSTYVEVDEDNLENNGEDVLNEEDIDPSIKPEDVEENRILLESKQDLNLLHTIQNLWHKNSKLSSSDVLNETSLDLPGKVIDYSFDISKFVEIVDFCFFV